jgi:hypothetical protein
MRDGIELIDEDITSFEPKQAVEFFRDVIWASASDAGVDVAPHVNLNIYTSDGGIDAEVENDFEIEVTDSDGTPLIPEGRTGYQIKTGSAPTNSDCKSELLNNDGEVKAYVKDVVSGGGTYIFVTFSQLTPEQREERTSAIEEQLAEKDCKNDCVEFFSATELVQFANRFPGLVFKYAPEGGDGCDIQTWSQHGDIRMPEEYVDTEHLSESIQEIRDLLAKSGEFDTIDGCPVCRVTGTAGLGKTRLVYEAVNTDQFSQKVIYDTASSFEDSELAKLLERNSNRSAVIVLDQCSRQQHESFVNRFAAYDRLALITISTDASRVEADTELSVGKFAKETIREILGNEFPEIASHTEERIARIADGYPEMALLVAKRYIEEEAVETVVDVSDSGVFDRILKGNEPAAPKLREIRKVMTPLAFFDRIPWRASQGEPTKEREWIIESFDLSSSFAQETIEEIIQYEKERGVLDGEENLSLGPTPLAAELMSSAIKQNPRLPDLILREDCPARLKRDFADRISYINNLDETKRWARNTLQQVEWFTPSGFNSTYADIFRALAEISPAKALQVLRRGIEGWGDLETLEERRAILEALRRIAVWEEYFIGAADLLQQLAEAETDTRFQNNATGIFAELFSAQTGPYAPTELPPSERVHLLERLLTADIQNKQRVGLEAAEQALELRGSRGIGIPHRQGAKPAPDLWVPEDNNDRITYLETVWQLVSNNLTSYAPEQQDRAVTILLDSSRKLAGSEQLAQKIQFTFRDLLEQETVTTQRILSATSQIVHYDAEDYSDDLAAAWERFEDELTNRSFHTKLQRYVGGHDLIDRAESRAERTENELSELARQAVESPELLRDEISWLHTANSQTAVEFGEVLGRTDADQELLEIFIDGLADVDSSASLAVFGGYLNVIIDSCEDAPGDVFERLLNDEHLRDFFPFLIRRADPSNRAASRIFQAVQNGHISIASFKQAEVLAREGKLSEDLFLEIGSYLVDYDTREAATVFVNLASGFYDRENAPSIDNDLVKWGLTHPELFEHQSDNSITGIWYKWTQLAGVAVQEDISVGFDIAESVIEALDEQLGIQGRDQFLETILNPLFTRQPRQSWELVGSILEDGRKRRWLETWLAGDHHAEQAFILTVPEQTLEEWVAEQPETRALALARCQPMMDHDGWWEFTRTLLVEYGDIDSVVDELNVPVTGGMRGDDPFENERQELQELRTKETEPMVREWLTGEIQKLGGPI